LAATLRSASTNLASTSSRSCAASLVRSPSVWAASAIELSSGFHPDVELDADIDPHAVLGDHRLGVVALDVEAQRLEVDPGDALEHRQHQRAAVEHDLLAAEAGADIGAILGGAAVEPGDDEAETEHRDDDDHGRNEDVLHDIHRCLPGDACVALFWQQFLSGAAMTRSTPAVGADDEHDRALADLDVGLVGDDPREVPVAVLVAQPGAATTPARAGPSVISAVRPTKSAAVAT